MLKSDFDNGKSIHRKRNHQIENMSISIDSGTSNLKHQNHEWTYMQCVHNQMSDPQSKINIYAICPYCNHLWLTTTKFCSQQVYVTTTNLSASLLATVMFASWELQVETEVIYVGLCYSATLGVSVTQAYGPSVDNSEFRRNFPRQK
jgi:hypothetical protein